MIVCVYKLSFFIFGIMSQAIQLFKKSVYQLCPKLSDDTWEYLASGLTIQSFKPKSFYIKEGEIQRTIGFVTQGLIRGYYVNDNGQEITIRFVRELGYATHYSSFITQQPSKYYFQCLEQTEIITLSYQHIQNGYRQYSELENYGRLIAEEVLKAQQKRIESFQFYNAEQRYLHFINDNPQLFNRISLTHLASYLGIERPSLSRIRRKLSR